MTRLQQNHAVSMEKAPNLDRNHFTSALRSGNDGRLGGLRRHCEADPTGASLVRIFSRLYDQ
jgi:hypothetical protein